MSDMTEKTVIPKYLAPIINDSALCQHILQLAKQSLSTPIYNHSLRVFLLAARINDHEIQPDAGFTMPSLAIKSATVSHEYLFAACMFHDMGTCPAQNGSQRFEVEGADAAIQMLSKSGYNDVEQLQQVWTAIALHTSSGIAERICPMASVLRRAVKADFDLVTRDALGLSAYAAEVEMLLPRLEIERVLATEVVAQAIRGEKENGLYKSDGCGTWTDNMKFPKASWPGILLRGHLEKIGAEGEQWEGINPAF